MFSEPTKLLTSSGLLAGIFPKLEVRIFSKKKCSIQFFFFGYQLLVHFKNKVLKFLNQLLNDFNIVWLKVKLFVCD